MLSREANWTALLLGLCTTNKTEGPFTNIIGLLCNLTNNLD